MENREMTLVRLPAPLKDRVRASAEANRRSMTREIQTLLERALTPAQPEAR